LGFSGKLGGGRSQLAGRQATALSRMPIQAPDQALHRALKDAGDAQQGADCDGAASLDLLPMAGRESVRNHVLLAVTRALAQLANTVPESAKESLLIRHALGCRLRQAN
jgi:hypothetical protein